MRASKLHSDRSELNWYKNLIERISY